MKRPKKEDYDFNDSLEGVRFASDAIKYMDFIEKKTSPFTISINDGFCTYEYKAELDSMSTIDGIAKRLFNALGVDKPKGNLKRRK